MGRREDNEGCLFGFWYEDLALALSCWGELGTMSWSVVNPDICLKLHYYQADQMPRNRKLKSPISVKKDPV